MKLLLVTQTRNKKGQVARTEQVIEALSFKLGRGAECAIHLPDPRIALDHATIGPGDDGSMYIEADDGAVSVDGSFERRTKLRNGQRILVGPYEIFVFEAPKPNDLGLTLELVDPIKEGEDADFRRNVQYGLGKTWLNKRLFSWAAFVVVLAAFLAWPVFNAMSGGESRSAQAKGSLTADASWDVGPLDYAHASFGRDCGKCHQEPFVQVKNEACESCHKSIGWHFPLETQAAKDVHTAVFTPPGDYRCASCHRDHKGVNGLVRTDATLCTDCHKDLKSRHPKIGTDNITDFAKDHPAFKLTMLVPGKAGKDALVRVAQTPALKENSGLKFAHDVHLAPAGIRGPEGKEKLGCKSCHARDEAGLRFKPVTMKDHCQRCHSLEFEPKVTTRQVPHGKVADVVQTVNEFYAQTALADTPIDVVVDAGIRRPGEKLTEAKRVSALKWATEKSTKIVNELFEARVCFVCHQVTKSAEEGEQPAAWQIAPIAVTQHFMPKARFPHNQHDSFDCLKCHEVSKSKTSADLAIPDLKVCQDCHGGNVPTKDKARGTCETCHGFHTGSSRSGVPVIIPGGELSKALYKPEGAKGETTREKPPAPRETGKASGDAKQ